MSKTIRVAILDLNNQTPNQGIFCLERIIQEFAEKIKPLGITCTSQIFDIRGKCQFPDPKHFDVYLSSGGPGSPYEGVGTYWESSYFKVLDSITHNNSLADQPKKYFFGICHSYELMTRYFEVGDIEPLDHKILGIMQFYLTPEGLEDPMLDHLGKEFFAFEARSWQMERLAPGIDIDVLAVSAPTDNIRPCVAAYRISPEIEGTQFHPEGDHLGILRRLTQPGAERLLTNRMGTKNYDDLLRRLQEPDYIERTRQAVIPRFLERCQAGLFGPSAN